MAEILLTHSYFLYFDPKEYRAMMPYPPLGTLYAASVLKRRGFSVAVHDSMFSKSETDIVPVIRRHKPKLVVIYDDQFNYLTKMCLTRMREAAFKMTRLATNMGCSVAVFSSDATDHIEEYFTNNADYVLCGEAENTLVELAEVVLNDPFQRVANIQGVAYREDSVIKQTPRQPLISDLDEIPYPAWDLAELSRYRSIWHRHHGYFSLNVVTTRGCPFHCNWCAKPIYGQVHHTRSPQNVVGELRFLKHFAKPEHIWFADDIFGLKPGWIAEFDEIINSENGKIPFKCLSRADLLLKEDNIRHLKNSGCETVWIGAESGSQKILDAMEKGITVEQIYRSTALLRDHGIRVGFFLQFGYPGETKEDIEKTLFMVKRCRPDEIGVSVSYPLPGTRFYERVKDHLGEKHNWVDSQDLDLMFSSEYSQDFYRVLHRVVHKRFSIWRGMQTARAIFSRPSSISGKSIRKLGSMMYHGMTLGRELRKLQILEKASKRNGFR